MTEEELKISEEAIVYVKKHQKEIVAKFADISMYPADTSPVYIIMAGSPGAGKTEFSKRLLEQFENSEKRIARIDPDEFRPLLPGYDGSNSFLFQGAISIVTDKILDKLFSQNQSFILDGTCSHYGSAFKNIQRSLGHNRFVYLFFVYQNPVTAWEVTQKRELKEGRNISKDVFIEEFISAQETVMKLKEEFKNQLLLNFVYKDVSSEIIDVYSGIDSIYDKLPECFTKDELYSILK